VSTGRLVQFWTTRENLEGKVIKALSKAFSDSPGIGWVRGNAVASEKLLAQINELRDNRDQLAAENAELKRQIQPRLVGIAGLNDLYTVRYAYQWWESRLGRWTSDNDGAELTWAEIFAAVGPAMMRPVSPGMISIKIINYLQEKRGIRRDNMTLFETEEAAIKIQLMALGLVDSQPATANGDGGISEFLSLTPRGRQQLLEVLAVRPSVTLGSAVAPLADEPQR
jgi:hypothetical protein